MEDDFYLAMDAARALEGAEVVGPYASEEEARAELDEERPDAVVVDINLGPRPSFRLAETLKDHGIPFVFMAGYNAEAITSEFAGVERLEKPFPLRQIVGAVAKMTTAALPESGRHDGVRGGNRHSNRQDLAVSTQVAATHK